MAAPRNITVMKFVLLVVCLFASGASCSSQQPGTLSVVKPAMDCSALASLSLHEAVGVDVTLQATAVSTAQGPFCHVTGLIAPAIHLEVDLPVERWTQRLLQAGCGGLCGMINASIGNAGGCQPAVNGEFVVAATDMGHQSQMGSPTEGSFAADPQKRIDFAYRANHLTALTAKAPEGLKGSELDAKQQSMLVSVIAQWAGNMNSSYADPRMEEIRFALNDTYFAWSGPMTHVPGQNGTSYYRIQGPKLVIEFSPQGVGGDPAMHVHTIYRDPTNDYGVQFTGAE